MNVTFITYCSDRWVFNTSSYDEPTNKEGGALAHFLSLINNIPWITQTSDVVRDERGRWIAPGR